MSQPYLILFLCPFHSVADAIASWGGAEEHDVRSSRASIDGHRCEVCGTSASRAYRLVWKVVS